MILISRRGGQTRHCVDTRHFIVFVSFLPLNNQAKDGESRGRKARTDRSIERRVRGK